MGRRKKVEAVDVAHYNYIWKMCIRMLYQCFINGDQQFAAKIKLVWEKCMREMVSKGIDQAAQQLADFTVCNDLVELSTFMQHHMYIDVKTETTIQEVN